MQSVKLDNKDYVFPTEAKKAFTNSEIIKAIHRSQHTQRNYDLSKKIPRTDLKTIVTSAAQCPSKQNTAFYDLHIIENQEVIKTIFHLTSGKASDEDEYKSLSNPQVLANVLLVFSIKDQIKSDSHREVIKSTEDSEAARIVMQDAHTAIGIAAGYVNLTASLLGYETGCCSCIMDYSSLKEMLNIDGSPSLLMGVGFKNEGVNRRIHALAGTDAMDDDWKEKLTTFKKQPINLYYVK
jgi:nitroreductase